MQLLAYLAGRWLLWHPPGWRGWPTTLFDLLSSYITQPLSRRCPDAFRKGAWHAVRHRDDVC